MSGISRAINESLLKKVDEALLESTRKGDVSRKLQAIKAVKTHQIVLVARIFGVSRVAIFHWIKKFASHGIEGLRLQVGRGRKSVLNNDEIMVVQSWIEAEHNITIKALQIRIKESFNKALGKSSAHNLIKELGFSYITPRPKHYKQNKDQMLEFKKKSGRATDK